MVRDYLSAIFHLAPAPFAKMYYTHYPFFALGHWPPLFYFISATWYLVTGVGRTQAMILQAIIATGSALLILWFVRQRSTLPAGFCAGLIFLALPEVQRWLCAVMVDQTVTLLSLGTAACLLYYLEVPTLRAGVWIGLMASATVMCKYSGIYICALPMAMIVVTRRFELLRRLSFWIQPAIMVSIIMPWWIWSRQFYAGNLTVYEKGLHHSPLLRIPTEITQSWLIFPPLLSVVVAIGLLLILLSPRCWKEDFGIVLFLYLGLVSFMALSGEDTERRYLLTGAAALIILSAAGWRAALDRPWPAGLTAIRSLLLPAVAGIALISSAANLLAFPHHWDPTIREVADFVGRNPTAQSERILLPTDLEGPLTAEFLLNDRQRPGFQLARPSRILASSDWNAQDYVLKYQSVPELMAALPQEKIGLILLHTNPLEPMAPHDRMLREGLSQAAAPWRTIPISVSSSKPGESWALLQYTPEPGQPGGIR